MIGYIIPAVLLIIWMVLLQNKVVDLMDELQHVKTELKSLHRRLTKQTKTNIDLRVWLDKYYQKGILTEQEYWKLIKGEQ